MPQQETTEKHKGEFMHKRRNVNSEPNLSKYSLTFKELLESFGFLVLSYHEKNVLGWHRDGLCLLARSQQLQSTKVKVQCGKPFYDFLLDLWYHQDCADTLCMKEPASLLILVYIVKHANICPHIPRKCFWRSTLTTCSVTCEQDHQGWLDKNRWLRVYLG